MPPSQLKQLKSSLRDSGVVGPQKSKKQKRQNAKTGAGGQERIRRNAALEAIRDRFNPFEIKTAASRSKFDVTTRDGGSKTDKNHRPGVTKSLGEVRRRETLLREMNRKNKVGGVIDRRIGENDPTMTPEERAAERFARESERRLRKESMFNLEEDDDEEEFQLTHKGQSLSFEDGVNLEDYSDKDMGLDEEDSDSELPHKRKRVFEDEDDMGGAADGEDEGEEGLPERKKSKHEVMKEVIAKSKFHKLERQQAKEDDDDLREELDKDLPDLFDMLRGVKPPPKPEPPKDDLGGMNPERAAWIEEGPGKDTEKEYDQRLRQMTFDQRSKPTDRTKTEEEKIEEEAQRLKKLEEERLRRMRGEESSEDEESAKEDGSDVDDMGDSDNESVFDDAKAFGFQMSTDQTTSRPELAVEDEDDFIIDDDLVETRSDVDLSLDGSDDEASFVEDSEGEEEDAQEDEHINGLTIPEGESATTANGAQTAADGLAYTYPCPSDHEEFLDIIKNVAVGDLPTVVQRIRALHHPRLASANKSKLGRFSAILVQHVAYMANQPEHPPFAVLENILRHVHSLAKSHPEEVSQAFRRHLRQMSTERPLNPLPGDLVILTGVFAIFPTSDHFHAIATPAHLTLARYLGQSTVNSLAEISTGTYAASLFLQYQAISKRYMPEFINYVLNALCILCPKEPTTSLGAFPTRSPETSLRLKATKSTVAPRTLRFWDITGPAAGAEEELKLSLITTLVKLLDTASDLWSDKSAFTEIFTPVHAVLTHLVKTWPAKLSKTTLQATLNKVSTHLSQARLHRRPLELHHHKPLAIKSAIPKFEESFNPDKHYDPNRERAELNKVKAEYKREKKGAMRELRKDANFVAREQLRQKKERDAEYERKYKRLVAEVQNEEGREANAYEREKRLRQGKR
ncbi:Nop14-like protein [Aspergillus taichungensis]|uniref:Nop14-like protein n=1 Tax=Aspergillus taichungensis TaxID=482145 RepID=A0A2J5HZ65_9EURO|nr:Nop14-like protein [Aspergillus taichungensis]